MKNLLMIAAVASAIAFSAGAMTAELDTDGDGLASITELQGVYPEVTDDLFVTIDMDGDGFVNDEELVAAIDSEILIEVEDDL